MKQKIKNYLWLEAFLLYLLLYIFFAVEDIFRLGIF